MQIGIQTRGFTLTEGLRDHCERRLRFALGSASDKVHGIFVRLTDENGPRGGVDKRCTIRAILRNAPPAVIVHDEADLYIAINRASDRVARAISRRTERIGSVRRGPAPSMRADEVESHNGS
jgi:ribosome-associated translation inhibitor RaiA